MCDHQKRHISSTNQFLKQLIIRCGGTCLQAQHSKLRQEDHHHEVWATQGILHREKTHACMHCKPNQRYMTRKAQALAGYSCCKVKYTQCQTTYVSSHRQMTLFAVNGCECRDSCLIKTLRIHNCCVYKQDIQATHSKVQGNITEDSRKKLRVGRWWRLIKQPSSQSDTVLVILNPPTAASVTCLGPDKTGSRPTQDQPCQQSVINGGGAHGVSSLPAELLVTKKFWKRGSHCLWIISTCEPNQNPMVTQMAQQVKTKKYEYENRIFREKGRLTEMGRKNN